MSGTHRHVEEEELLLHLYGAGGEDMAGRLAGCRQCEARWARLQARRAAVLEQAGAGGAGAGRLRAQRAAVWARIEEPRRALWMRALQAAAAAAVLVAAVVLQGPAPGPEPRQVASVQAVSDAQLYADLTALLAQDAPRAADPLKALFMAESTEEVQESCCVGL